MQAHWPRVRWRIDRSLMGRSYRQPAGEPGLKQRRQRRKDIEPGTEELECLNLLAFARPLDIAVCHECVTKKFCCLQV
jgi:hypothetical protein